MFVGDGVKGGGALIGRDLCKQTQQTLVPRTALLPNRGSWAGVRQIVIMQKHRETKSSLGNYKKLISKNVAR